MIALDEGPFAMLERPQSKKERNARLNRLRVARSAAREKAGVRVAHVEYNGATLNMLVALGWLADGSADDRRAVGQAISRLIADASKDFA